MGQQVAQLHDRYMMMIKKSLFCCYLLSHFAVPKRLRLQILTADVSSPNSKTNFVHFNTMKIEVLGCSEVLVPIYKYTGLFEMTVGVLTTCHTQYT